MVSDLLEDWLQLKDFRGMIAEFMKLRKEISGPQGVWGGAGGTGVIFKVEEKKKRWERLSGKMDDISIFLKCQNLDMDSSFCCWNIYKRKDILELRNDAWPNGRHRQTKTTTTKKTAGQDKPGNETGNRLADV